MSYKLKNSFNKFFKKVDFRIIFIFIIFILIGLFILFYKYSRYIDCSKVDFAIEAERKQVGEIIGFKDLTPNAKSWVWDFGDNSAKIYDRSPFHKYDKSGMYIVTLQVNGSCTFQKTLEIRGLGKIIDSMKIPKIIAPTVVTVGQPVEVYYKYLGEAFSWEWSFGESGQMDNTSEYPVYSYSSPGKKRLTLVVNGDITHIASRDIYVKPRILNVSNIDTLKRYIPEKDTIVYYLPPGNPQKDPMEEFLRYIPAIPMETPVEEKISKVEENLAPSISENQFELLLIDVAKQNKAKEDFGIYTCNNYDFPVIKNEKIIIPFSEFCDKIQNKKIKIESIRLIKDNKNCIVGLVIKYKTKKGLFWVYE